MAGTVCFTSFTFGYLPRARVLARTLRAVHPDWHLAALLVDAPPPGLRADGLELFDSVRRADELAIPDFRAWMFGHDLVEAATAVKAPMLRALLAEGAERVIYLDPDIAVLRPLAPVMGALARASIVLTPHQISPEQSAQAVRDNERAALLYGVFNLGFLGVRNDAAGQDFARWWTARTHAACHDAPEQGLFTDQRWCDLVPALFDGVHILRDPGCNVASWNLSQREPGFDPAGALTVCGVPLRFYHFTKIGGVGDIMTERYGGENVAVHEVVNWYRRAVAAEACAAAAWPWHWGRFDSGAAIGRAARRRWREEEALRARLGDPYGAAAEAWFAAAGA